MRLGAGRWELFGPAAFAAASCVLGLLGCHPGGQPGGFVKADGDGASRHVVFVPRHRTPGERLPVILFLNGKGENGADGLRQVGNNFGGDVWRMRGHFPFLAVCPQCPEMGDWKPGSPTARAALAALDEVIAEYGGDPDRVYITGPSNGGEGALGLVAAYPDRFAAVVPIATGGPADQTALAAAGVPCWAYYNARDAATLVASARQMRANLLAAGNSPIMIELDRAGHNAWDVAYGSPALFGWLLEQSREKNAPSKRFELLTPGDLLGAWERRGPDPWLANGDELRTTPPAGERDAELVSPVLRGDLELHLDVYLDGKARGRVALIAASGPEARRGEVVLEQPADGTGGLRGPDGDWSSPLDPVGQRALRRGWNDVRLFREGDRWRLRLNGWPALDVSDPAAGGPVRLGLVAAVGEPAVRWRFIRFRSASDHREDAA